MEKLLNKFILSGVICFIAGFVADYICRIIGIRASEIGDVIVPTIALLPLISFVIFNYDAIKELD